MPDREFTKMSEVGPIRASADAEGIIDFPAGGGGGPATVADGADVTQGAIADAAVITDAPGTLSAKLRGLVTLFVNLLSRWPAALGQQTRAGSISVTQASDATGVNAPQLQGAAADGAAAAGNPVLVAGLDASNLAQALFTDSSGRLKITGDVTTAADGVGTSNTTIGVTAYPYAFNGTSWDKVRTVNTMKTAQSTATASGSALALWTPAAGKKFRLRTLHGRASIAGRYEVRDGAVTVIGYIYLEINRWTAIMDMEANGYLSAAANNVLNIYNVSGSAADMDFLCSGNEE